MRSQTYQNLCYALFGTILFCGCNRAPKTGEDQATPSITDGKLNSVHPATSNVAEKLASAWVQLASTKPPDEALTLLALALNASPNHPQALTASQEILEKTTWHLPLATLPHRLPVTHLEFSPPSSLWVNVASGTNTTMLRWNLDTLEIEALLFPVTESNPRCLVFDPSHRFMIIERGSTVLLCDAQTLNPIRELGPLDPQFTPSAVISFSADGTLLAHPQQNSTGENSTYWVLRESKSGEIIRTFDPLPASDPRPLAAHLGREHLRILREDGSISTLPLSPTEQTLVTPPEEPVKLLHAQFSSDGDRILTLQDRGLHLPRDYRILTTGPNDDGTLTAKSLLERFPWSRGPGLWDGLMRTPKMTPLEVSEKNVSLTTQPCAPFRITSPLATAAFSFDSAILGEESGIVSVHRLLPLPAVRASSAKPLAFDPQTLTHFSNLVKALTGKRYDEALQQFTHLTFQDRLEAINRCDFQVIQKIFPTLDFSPITTAFKSTEPRTPAPDALLPLWNRLLEADSSQNSWPSILSFSRDLAETQWHRDLATAIHGTDSPTPWNAPARLTEIFATDKSEQILSEIHAAGPNGTAAATALALALESDHPEWIQACLTNAVNLPKLLEKLARSRIAQLEGRHTEALAGWPEPFPTVPDARTREDWQGWEQADFTPALEKIRAAVLQELAAIQVPPSATVAQRLAVTKKLSDPATLAIVGRSRFALACLNAAQAFSAFPEESAVAVALASRARELGAAAVPCLRAEATALTALADFPKAHARWIELITEHPVPEHLSGDYAEAAYTAFENLNPDQAMEILTTGHRRFPDDANFALRAGWIAMLTGTPRRAYQFLKAGQLLGYPAEKSEEAAALLATAAAQSGAVADASLYLEELLALAPHWANPETIAAMNWPDEMKSSFTQLLAPEQQPMLDPRFMQDLLPEPLPTDP